MQHQCPSRFTEHPASSASALHKAYVYDHANMCLTHAHASKLWQRSTTTTAQHAICIQIDVKHEQNRAAIIEPCKVEHAHSAIHAAQFAHANEVGGMLRTLATSNMMNKLLPCCMGIDGLTAMFNCCRAAGRHEARDRHKTQHLIRKLLHACNLLADCGVARDKRLRLLTYEHACLKALQSTTSATCTATQLLPVLSPP